LTDHFCDGSLDGATRGLHALISGPRRSISTTESVMHGRAFLLLQLTIGLVWTSSIMASDDAKQELAKLQGDWIIVSAEIDGAPVAAEDLKEFRRTVKGDEIAWRMGSDHLLRTRFKIDPARSPKHWDVTFLDGDEQGQTCLGIYELKDNQLKICVGGPNGERPLEFATKPDSDGIFLVLRRAAGSTNDAVRNELERHQGTWVAVSFEREGQKTDDAVVKNTRRVVKGNRIVWKQGDAKFAETEFEIDPSKNPKAIDVLPSDGPARGKRVLGIYQINGDELTICMAGPDMERPQEFSAKENSGQTLMVFRRESP
jgi:uncharacterized protein (TIGR03067 family)